MSQLLIADAGSTKTEWALVDSAGMLLARTVTGGINISVSDELQASERISEANIKLEEAAEITINPEAVFFYGAGCNDIEKCQKVESIISAQWMNAKEIEVSSDMLGVVRSLFGNNPGLGCILGTGSNSCLYDGKEITANIPPLGYILGDEGSGAVLGKRLLSDIFKGLLDNELTTLFSQKYGLDKSEVIDRVYRQPEANRFLASFVPFIADNISHPIIDKMVTDEIRRFFERDILPYNAPAETAIGFVGGVAITFEKLIKRIATEFGFTVGTVLPTPMPGLIMYHSLLSSEV